MIKPITAMRISVQMLRLASLKEDGINAGGCQRKHVQEWDRPGRELIRFKNKFWIGGSCTHGWHLID